MYFFHTFTHLTNNVKVSRGNRVKKKEMIKIKDFLRDNKEQKKERTKWTKIEVVIPTGMKYRYFNYAFHKISNIYMKCLRYVSTNELKYWIVYFWQFRNGSSSGSNIKPILF